MTERETVYARRAFIASLVALGAACGRSDVTTGRAPTSTSTTSSTTSSSTTTSTTTTAPAAEPAPAPPGPVGLVCRGAWGAQPARTGGRTHAISRLTVHHSAVVLSDGDDPARHLRQYQTTHMGPNGWVDIAYHLAVDRAGTAYELRSTAIAGDTATAYDPAGHLLILAIGNFEEQSPTEAQLDGVARLLRWGADTFTAPLASVTGHRDHVPTACPGDALYAQLGEVRRRAEAIPAGSSGIATC